MKNSISIASSVAIFFGMMSISFGENLCSTEYQAELPKWFSKWKNSTYGLEFPAKPSTDGDLSAFDVAKMNTYNANGPGIIKNMLETHLEKIKKNQPQFRIRKVDPIEYEYANNRKMWLILKNINLWNLDTYDANSIKYHREGHLEHGPYYLTDEMYEAMENRKYQTSDKLFKKTNNENHSFERNDIVWTMNASAQFLSTLSTQRKNSFEDEGKRRIAESSQTTNEPKPIIIQAEFKIQPPNHDSDNDADRPLRASGVVTLHVFDFNFDLTIIVRHIDKCLKEHLPEKKQCWNRVPDFDLKYGMQNIVIHEIQLTKYDQDDEWQNGPSDDEEDVNDYLVNNDGKNNAPTIDETPLQSYAYVPGDTEIVKQHLEILRKQIEENSQGMIRKRLCINLAYKITWKVMQMESKQQFPGLIREIIQYDDNFNRKSTEPPAPAPSMGWKDKVKTGVALGSSLAKSSVGRFLKRNNSE